MNLLRLFFKLFYLKFSAVPCFKSHPSDSIPTRTLKACLNIPPAISHIVILLLHSGVFPNAFTPVYSTETALLRVQNDILCAIDDNNVELLVLLGLSAAYIFIHFK